ncbi:MAG: hypothetical protein U0Q07_12975 [Acidimicrobiales bacterium]
MRRGTRSGIARGIVTSAVPVAVAVVLTWPLVANLRTALPLGREAVATVPRFNLWTLDWTRLQLGRGWTSWWDAPIFHPTPGAFALSEPQPLTGLVAAPFTWLASDPVVGYGVVLLLGLALAGIGATRLARRLGVATGPAVAAGVLAQALPFVAAQLGVLQLVMVFPAFFALDALLAWDRTGRRRWALALGAWLAVAFLTCSYYGLFLLTVGGAASLTLLWPRRPRGATDPDGEARDDPDHAGEADRAIAPGWRRRVVDLALAAVVLGVLAGPVLVAQLRLTSDYRRGDQTILDNSATPADWLHLPDGAVGARLTTAVGGEDVAHEDALYPGTILLALAGTGVALAVAADRRSPTPDGAARRRALVLLGAVAVVAFALSFGLTVQLGGWHPYDLVRHVPGFAELRSPFRAGVLVQVALVPAAALTLDALWRHRRHWGPAAVVAVCLLAVLEVWPFPQRLAEVPPAAAGGPPTAWASWLADQPGAGAGIDGGAVAFVPFPETNATASYEQTTGWMLEGLDSRWPTVNGYSGLFPAEYDELEAAMRAGFPRPETIRALRDRRVRFVVVDRRWLLPSDLVELARFPDDLREVHTDDEVVIYALTA